MLIKAEYPDLDNAYSFQIWVDMQLVRELERGQLTKYQKHDNYYGLYDNYPITSL